MTMPIDSGLPAWIRGASSLGVPSLIALGLVWWLTMKMEASQARIEHMLQVQAAFSYATCLNAASDSTSIARCAVALDGALEKIP